MTAEFSNREDGRVWGPDSRLVCLRQRVHVCFIIDKSIIDSNHKGKTVHVTV